MTDTQYHCRKAELHIYFARKTGRLRKIDVDRLKWAVELMEKELKEERAA